jgi:hypothetical protein
MIPMTSEKWMLATIIIDHLLIGYLLLKTRNL